MVSIKAVMKKVQMVEKKREVLEDVGKTLEAKDVEDLICYEFNEPSSNCFFFTSENLRDKERTKLIEFLEANNKVLAWTPYEMPGIDQDFIKHNLDVIPEAHLVK